VQDVLSRRTAVSVGTSVPVAEAGSVLQPKSNGGVHHPSFQVCGTMSVSSAVVRAYAMIAIFVLVELAWQEKLGDMVIWDLSFWVVLACCSFP
jgi:hypothetical protein